VIAHAPAGSAGILAFGAAETAFPFAGGTLVPVPAGLIALQTDDAGRWVQPDVAGPRDREGA
jgi:hypothetical protein